MDISSIDNNSTAIQSMSDSSSSTTSDSKVEELEKEKARLEQELREERNQFALTQSDKYRQIKKKIADIDKSIQQAKAQSSSDSQSVSSSNNVSDISKVNKSNNNDNDSQDSITSTRRLYDEFIHSDDNENNSSSGIYSINKNNDGSFSVLFDGDEFKNNNTPYKNKEE